MTPDAKTEITKEEWCQRFVEHMTKHVGFETFDDGGSVREYAEMTAPTYWDEPNQREDGPEYCAETDVSYWEE